MGEAGQAITGAGGGGEGGPGAGPAGEFQQVWGQGFTPEEQQYVNGRGWKSPHDVITNFQSFEKARGYSADRLVVLPEKPDDPAADYSEVYAKLGRPAEAKDYDLGELKPAEGEKDFVTPFRELAHKLGLNAKQARGIADYYTGMGQELDTLSQQASDDEQRVGIERVKQEWGKAYDEKLGAIRTAVKAYGIDMEEGKTFDKLVSALGTADTYKLLAKMGEGLAEFKPGDTSPGGARAQIKTPEWARAQIAQREKDPEFFKRRFSEDTAIREAAAAEWKELHEIAASGSGA